MKKKVVLLASIAALQFSVTAFADLSATDTDNVTATTRVTGTSTYSTVLIKDGDDNIVYLNQADDLFTATSDFLLQANPAYGKYTVLLGSSGNQSDSTYLYVGVQQGNDDVRMKRLPNEGAADSGKYNIGYYTEVEADDLKDYYNSLKVGYADNETYGGYDLSNAFDTQVSGGGSLYLIFQLDNVPAAVKDSMTVSLSPDSVGTETVDAISAD